MFYYLNGKIALLDANLAVVDCGGVGYACHVTTITQSRLRVGEEARLFTYCNIKEDAFDIYGFATREELRLFELLLGVNGVGPRAALSILSALTADQFTLAVLTGDDRSLTMAQGVGKKLAQRIVLELKDKLGNGVTELDFSGNKAAPASGGSHNLALATAALAELGYNQSDISAALKGLPVESMTTEEIVRQALRAMVTG